MHVMDDSVKDINETSEVISSLASDADRVSMVLDVIKGIANQT